MHWHVASQVEIESFNLSRLSPGLIRFRELKDLGTTLCLCLCRFPAELAYKATMTYNTGLGTSIPNVLYMWKRNELSTSFQGTCHFIYYRTYNCWLASLFTSFKMGVVILFDWRVVARCHDITIMAQTYVASIQHINYRFHPTYQLPNLQSPSQRVGA